MPAVPEGCWVPGHCGRQSNGEHFHSYPNHSPISRTLRGTNEQHSRQWLIRYVSLFKLFKLSSPYDPYLFLMAGNLKNHLITLDNKSNQKTKICKQTKPLQSYNMPFQVFFLHTDQVVHTQVHRYIYIMNILLGNMNTITVLSKIYHEFKELYDANLG